MDKICLLRLWGTVSTIQLTDQGLDVPEDLIALMVTMIGICLLYASIKGNLRLGINKCLFCSKVEPSYLHIIVVN